MNIMLLPCYLFLLCSSAMMAVSCASADGIIALETALTAAQNDIIQNGYKIRSSDLFYGGQHEGPREADQRIRLLKENRSLRLHIVKYAWNQNTTAAEKLAVFSSVFGEHAILQNGDISVLNFFLKPENNFNMNHYSKDAGNWAKLASNIFYDGSSMSFDTSGMTPLMVAVLLNKPEMVQSLVDASLTPKLQLDQEMDGKAVTARSMARKIKNESVRVAMLSKLKIDPTKHDMTKTNLRLKEDLEINVKEAVIANDFGMLESALLLGNFGDKTDLRIAMTAIENGNFIFFEILAMEGYALPAAGSVRCTETLKEYVDEILAPAPVRVPMAKRDFGFWRLYTPFNYLCF